MKIAVIEDQPLCHDIIKAKIFKDTDWDVEFFLDAETFGKQELSQYDVIIADNRLPKMSGRDLLKSVSGKSHAQLLLMSAYDIDFLRQETIDDGHIMGFVDKDHIEQMKDQLSYIDSKLRISNMIDSETNRINNMLANGFSLNTDDGVLLIQLKELVGEQSRKNIIDKVAASKILRSILYFNNAVTLTSQHMGILASLYKALYKLHVDVVYWNQMKSKDVRNQLATCRLDKLFPVMDTLEEAKSYLL